MRQYSIYSKTEPERALKCLLKKLIGLFLKRERTCHIALAGGKTPLNLYRELSKESLPWHKIKFYLTDERYVPFTSTLSNYRMIRESLGDRARVNFLKTEMLPQECAMDYSFQLPDRLHISLLGVGSDGHTASLFPSSGCEDISPKVCISKDPEGIIRLSLKEDYLNSSCVVVFFLKGEEKRRAFEGMLRGDNIPASRIRGRLRTYVFTDLL